MIRLNKGIALIQVLLITGLLTVFVLYISQSAQQQIQIATFAKEKASNEVEVHSALSLILFNLLTENRSINVKAGDEYSIANKWNYYGSEFELGSHVKVKMQDQSGLLSLRFINKGLLVKLLTSNGIGAQRAEQIADTLLDWQDADSIQRPAGKESVGSNAGLIRNGKIAHKAELGKILDLSNVERRLIEDNMTLFYVGDLNLIAASEELIAIFSSKSAAEQVERLRKSNSLTVKMFSEFTGLGYEEGTRLSPSSVVSIEMIVSNNNTQYRREMVISISPYAKGAVSTYNILLDRS